MNSLQFMFRKSFQPFALLTLMSVLQAADIPGTVHAWGSSTSGQLGNGFDELTPQPSLAINVNRVAAGLYHTLAVKNDGTVWDWGNNSNGQLGNGTTLNSSFPIQVMNISGAIAVSGGGFHSIALKNDGTVWAWGFNYYGQLGIGSQVDSAIPVQISSLSGITAIACGLEHTLALKNDGTVWAWGFGGDGELGNGASLMSTIPVQVSGLTGVIAIAAGYTHSLALKGDGTVMTWGANNFGQLGDGTTKAENTPVLAGNLTGCTAISAGETHCIALKNDGTVMAWGNNVAGELGNGVSSGGQSSTPAPVPGAMGITAISAGAVHNLALKSDGTVLSWGDNFVGELGNGNTDGSNVASPVGGLTGVTALAAGGTFSVVLKADGTLAAWGSNANGQFGAGIDTIQVAPILTPNVFGAIAISAGWQHTLALKSDGTVWAWGLNESGQLGNGTFVLSDVPVQVSSLAGIIAVAGGDHHSVALKNDGTVWSWGLNGNGQLGNEDATVSNVPIQVSNLTNVTAISARRDVSLALKSDGTVWAWGDNIVGQLGNGTNKFSSVAVMVNKLSGVTAIAVGRYFCMALKSDGTVATWGDNTYGNLGTGSTKSSKVAVTIKKFSGITKIAAGGFHALALRNDGSVLAWGRNDSGQLGNGRTSNVSTPARILGLSDVTALAGGDYHSLAIKSDRTVLSWGADVSGQLGRNISSLDGAMLGSTDTKPPASSDVPGIEFSSTPAPVPGIIGATALAAGEVHSLAILDSTAGLITTLNPAAVLEQSPIGTLVGAFFTTDPSGLGTSFTYALVAGAGGDDNASFSVSGNKLSTAAVFSFDIQPTYTIRVRTSSNTGNSIETVFTISVLAQPNSGADGTENVSNITGDDGTVINPVSDLAISVSRSDGGSISLQIVFSSGANSLMATTRFDDIPGRAATARGWNPVHKFTQRGIYVAEVIITDQVTGFDVAKGRKMINISSEETLGPAAKAERTPRLLKPADSRIPTKDLKGTFYFSGVKNDTVTYMGSFTLPSGFNPSQGNDFSFGIGNVVVDTTVDVKGNVTPVANSQHAPNNTFFKKMAIKFGKLPKGGVATGNETAVFIATIEASALTGKGFDTEGITNTKANDLQPGGSTERNIQVSYNVNGITYEDKASVIFVLNNNNDFGQISGRSKK